MCVMRHSLVGAHGVSGDSGQGAVVRGDLAGWGHEIPEGRMAHGQDHEHEHAHLEELHTVWLAARRAWRVSLRVHLEVEHDWAGRGDPERVHRDLHNRD